MRHPGFPAGGALSWVLALPRSQIRWKIIAPYVVLVLLLAALGTFIVTRFVTSSLDERFSNQLAEAARVTSDSLVRRERQHLSVLRAIAFTEGVAEAAEVDQRQRSNRLVYRYYGEQPRRVRRGAGRQRATHPRPAARRPREPTCVPIDDDANRDALASVVRVRQRYSDATGDKFTQISKCGRVLAHIPPD